jgi:transposase
MEVICPRCAGLDVHKQTVVACVRIAGDGPTLQEVRTFATTTSGLLALADWLESHGVQVVAMEATGVYWKPVCHRTRKQFVRERTAHSQRIDKVLEDANLKLGAVLSDVLGKSGRAVLQAIIDGHTDPERLASCVTTRVKASRAELLEALRGHVSAHHRFMLKVHLAHIDALDRAIADIEKEVGLGLDTFRQAAKLLSTMPGLSAVGSNVVIAEIGIDMSRFATPAHLLSWACMCPRNDESAGKRRSTRLRRGGKWLKTTMVQAAWAAVKVKGSYLQAQFHRLRARRGAKKAIIAVAASMLTAAWHMLRNGTEWHDLGAAHFDRADAHKTALRLVRRLQHIGYAVQLTPA